MDLDVYRQQAETFRTELDRAYYRHFAGHDAALALAPIYERHAALFARGAVQTLQAAAQRAVPTTDAGRRTRTLWDFALEGYVGELTKSVEEELARREVSITLQLPGESATMGYRESSVRQANEPDGDRRAAIEQARHRAVAAELGELHRELIETQHSVAVELGFHSYRALCEASKGLDLSGLYTQTQAFVAATDLDSRPGKTPRAFCAPVRVPAEVYLVLTPIGGREDYAILFHEGGHTEQFAHIAPELPFEFRCLGDDAATEAFAFLLAHLTDEPAWQARHLGDGGAPAGFARASRFVYLRQYTAKLAYELELHGGDRPLAEMPARYTMLLGAGLGVPWSSETYLSDVDPGFYCAGYLRAWALEAHLRTHLRERFGEIWWEVAEAGALLRDLWRGGLRLSAEEMLCELTGETLDFGILLADLDLA